MLAYLDAFRALAAITLIGVPLGLILNRFAGRWEINEYLRNPTAVSFWRRVISTYTQGKYE